MALLVASLLLAALAPVITRKLNDSITVSVEGEIPGKTTKTHEIIFGSQQCPAGTNEIKIASDGSEYCEGEFIVPMGYNGPMKVTVVGAGGGGAAASTAGYVEYKTPGDGQTFIVPPAVNKVEATLIGGGAAGGAGGKKIETWEKLTGGQTNWPVPPTAKNNFINVKICGAGGGHGTHEGATGTGGGSGAYISKMVSASANSVPIIIGGRGGNVYGIAGSSYGGGGAGNGATYGGSGADNIGGNGGNGNDIGGGGASIPTHGTGARDGGTNGVCTDKGAPVIATGAGGSGGSFKVDSSYESHLCSGGSGGNIGGGGGGGGGWGAGGGGGAASVFGINGAAYYISASGGGGGAGHLSTGGGGGGLKGGNGGDSCLDNGVSWCAISSGGYGAKCSENGALICAAGGNGSGNKEGGQHAPSPTDEFPNNCGGGKDGAIRIYYPENAAGGTGGGGAAIIPYQQISVNPLETLYINIAQRASGATAGGYKENGEFIDGNYGELGKHSSLKRGTTVILNTCFGGHLTHCGNHYGAGVPAGVTLPSGTDGRPGPISDINGNFCFGSCPLYGASNSYGRAAGNDGGMGGTTTVFGKQTCETPNGGTAAHPDGYDAGGYGCGGGGGSHGGRGGSGSGGYARISWNMYWDIALNSGKGDYKYAEFGGGGGGASGNVTIYKLDNVKSGEKIKIRIGKGGAGGYAVSTASNGEFISPKKGGDTVFAYGTNRAIKAGGGSAGTSPKINNTVVENGLGGTKSVLCSAGNGNKDFISIVCASKVSTDCCIVGQNGSDAQKANGGKGANLANYGEGGLVRSAGSGNTDGIDAITTGFGAGGGGASLRYLGVLNASETTSNPTRGGSGSNGKIILEWWE